MIDLFRPRLTVSSEVFQVVFVHLVYNSALFFGAMLLLLLLLFILVTCFSLFDLYLFGLLVNWFCFKLFQNFFIPIYGLRCTWLFF